MIKSLIHTHITMQKHKGVTLRGLLNKTRVFSFQINQFVDFNKSEILRHFFWKSNFLVLHSEFWKYKTSVKWYCKHNFEYNTILLINPNYI